MNLCLQLSGVKNRSLKDMQEGNYVIAVQNGISDFQVGDVIHLKADDTAGGMKEFKIAGVLQTNITYRGYCGAGNDFILHQKQFRALHLDNRVQRAAVSVEQSAKENVKNDLEELVCRNQNLKLESYDELKEEYAASKEALAKSSYSLLVFLFCISIVNLLNTSLSNILSQKKELGMLEAIGLAKDQEKNLIQMEGLVLVLGSGIIAVLIGIPLGYAGFYFFRKSASYAIYKVPVIQCFMLLTGYVMIQIFTTKIAQLQLSKYSIMEKISQENL